MDRSRSKVSKREAFFNSCISSLAQRSVGRLSRIGFGLYSISRQSRCVRARVLWSEPSLAGIYNAVSAVPCLPLPGVVLCRSMTSVSARNCCDYHTHTLHGLFSYFDVSALPFTAVGQRQAVPLYTHLHSVLYNGESPRGRGKAVRSVSFTYFFFCCLVLCDSPP